MQGLYKKHLPAAVMPCCRLTLGLPCGTGALTECPQQVITGYVGDKAWLSHTRLWAKHHLEVDALKQPLQAVREGVYGQFRDVHEFLC